MRRRESIGTGELHRRGPTIARFWRIKSLSRVMRRVRFVVSALGVVLVLLATGAHAQAPPKHEFRGAWSTTVYNLDCPSSRTASHSSRNQD